MKLVAFNIFLVLLVVWHKAEAGPYYYNYPSYNDDDDDDYDGNESDENGGYNHGYESDEVERSLCGLPRMQYGRKKRNTILLTREKRLSKKEKKARQEAKKKINNEILAKQQALEPPCPCEPKKWFIFNHVFKEEPVYPYRKEFNENTALAFTKSRRTPWDNPPTNAKNEPVDLKSSTVFQGIGIMYNSDQWMDRTTMTMVDTCKIYHPVTTYICFREASVGFTRCDPLGMCTGHTAKSSGHLFPDSIQCQKTY